MSKTTIVIAGREYSIISDESGEYVNQIAYELNRRIDEIAGQYVGLATNTATVLAALNLTDELTKAKDMLKKAQEEIDGIKDKLRQTEIALNLSAEKAQAQDQQSRQAMKEQLAKLEEENNRLRVQQGRTPRR